MKKIAKSLLRNAAARLGYRIVPRDRDAMTLRTMMAQWPIRTVFDVGANRGDTSREWLQMYPRAHVHAIEALDHFYRELERTASGSQGRITAWNYAASDAAETLEFFEQTDHPSSSSLLKSTAESHELLPFTERTAVRRVQAITLDALIEENAIELTPNILIKLDVQGAEGKVLAGAPHLLDRTQAVLIEVNLLPLYQDQVSFGEIISRLDTHELQIRGFLEQFHATDGSAIYVDALFSRR